MKHPDTQLITTRLMIEAGFRNKNWTYDQKVFCEATGLKPRTLAGYLDGKSSISVQKVRKLLETLNLKTFDIV
jgi:transcriptional regulator with XRE-family HTH domain